MSVMTEARLRLPTDRPMAVPDLDDTPDDGLRYELDDGVLVVSPAPMWIHQIVLARLTAALVAACSADFAVASGPGVEVSDIKYWIPDLAVVRAESLVIGMVNVTAPPVLVIEIASPSTAHFDQNRKKAAYAEFGIPAYWIVDPDPQRPSITEFQLAGAVYREVSTATGREPFVADAPFPVQIVPADLVTGPWRRSPGALPN
jgi:Uma2 family endonuclease